MRLFETKDFSLDGKVILVTGGTGSFGKRFIRTILNRWTPRKVVVYSRDEMKQWEMSYDPDFKDYDCIRYLLGDVRDLSRLEMAMQDVDYVVHAAALKHVPAAEYNPFECIRTNVIGAENVVQASIRVGVKKVIALSTDKAANPINLYGASKLASDKIFVAGNNLSGRKKTRFSVVRYGNVVGSRGSVIPLFQRLIKDGADHLPVTDERMTRFWITLDQGVAFVLSCFEMMSGGEIFVPKIPSMRITDLAKAVAPNLPIKIIGIRPGEKLHEVMISEDDARKTVDMGDRYVIEPEMIWWTRDNLAPSLATPVPETFSYASNTNSEWLGPEELNTWMEDGA
jgi:UDP-N-acetylglucosamine 4,6-dehydratase